MEAQKYIALVVVTDKSACAYVRWRNWAHIMNSQAGGDFEILVTCSPIFDDYILYHSACVIVTRPCAEVHEDVVKRYGKLKNKYNYKLMLDYDDILFDLQGRDTFPDYNPFKQRHNAFEGGERIGRMVKYVDAILVSTLYLAACFASRFGSDVVGKTVLLQNYVPATMYTDQHGEYREGEPLRIMYTGASSHYKEGSKGDLEGPWLEAVEKFVKNGHAQFFTFGKNPGFFPAATEWLPFVSAAEWPYELSRLHPDICIGPLQCNPFNRSKSDLKLLEASAIGAAFVGSYFNDGPYNDEHAAMRVTKSTTVNELYDILDSLREPGNMDAVLRYQRGRLADGHRTMEDREARDYFMTILFHKYLTIN